MSSSLAILTFHSIEDRRSAISFPPHLFRYGLAKLRAQGYRSLGLSEAIEFLQKGAALPQRALVITFDDGYGTVYDEAFPVLQEFGITATVFLTTGDSRSIDPDGRLSSREDRSMLSWRQIIEMSRAGISFGAHTLTHPDLRRLAPERMEAEICESKEIIEDVLQRPVTSFAYPFGLFDARSREIVRKHFSCACTTRLGLVTPASDLFALERVETYYFRSKFLFDLMLTGCLPWYLKARSIPRRIRSAFDRITGLN